MKTKTRPRPKSQRNTISKRVRFEILKRDKFKCRYCGVGYEKEVLVVDHIDPCAGGGGNHPDNLVTACESCNAGKADVPLSVLKYRLRPEPPILVIHHDQQYRDRVMAEVEAAYSITFRKHFRYRHPEGLLEYGDEHRLFEHSEQHTYLDADEEQFV